MARGIFPTMPPSEIVGYLNNWDINISHELLLRPTPEFVESVYYACLERVTSISLDSIRNPVQNALVALEDSDQVCVSVTINSEMLISPQDLYSVALIHNILLHHL
jgi:kinetochore protein Nuf2